MAKKPNHVADNGFTRLYQAWVSWPEFISDYGEWIHGTNIAVGNPRTSAKKCHEDLERWCKRNKKEIDAIHKEVAESGRVGSDIRVNRHVYQIWPITENGPWNSGMFGQSISDPFK